MVRVVSLFERIPDSLIALSARGSIAATFWTSGQTKVQGFVVEVVTREVHLGWPHLSDAAVARFRDEYRRPFIAPEIAAPLAATAELLFPLLLLLIGLGTRLSALALQGTTLVIEVFVYPDAYPHAWRLGGRVAVPDGARAGCDLGGPLARSPVALTLRRASPQLLSP